MTPQQAIDAGKRLDAYVKRQHRKLNDEILKPYFAGNECRRHNCIVNYESGLKESDHHYRDYKLAKLYAHKQEQLWSVSRRLSEAFARYY